MPILSKSVLSVSLIVNAVSGFMFTHHSTPVAHVITASVAITVPPVELVKAKPPVMNNSLTKWDTALTDKTASWPDATDPTWKLSHKAQIQLACVRYLESRNHSWSNNTSSGAQGWYQFIPYIWDAARSHIPGLPSTPLKATNDQQSEVAVWYYLRNGGLNPEWSGDNC